MKNYNQREFIKIIVRNGFVLNKKRGKGTHAIYENERGQHICVSKNISAPIARRLIKEFNLL